MSVIYMVKILISSEGRGGHWCPTTVLRQIMCPLFQNIYGIALPASTIIWQSTDSPVSETLAHQQHDLLVILIGVAGRLQDVSELHWSLVFIVSHS